jgi:outer membrane protein OmpA-like peptidoglycan-associated protein
MRKMKIAASALVVFCLMVMVGANMVTGQQEIQATNLGPVVNSIDSDFGPMITADGNALYFTSDREGGYGGQDIWVSRKVNGQWSTPENLGEPVNTKYNEGPDTFSVDERQMYFTRCDKIDDRGTCDIYMASWDETTVHWVDVRNLGTNINSRFNDANASLSVNGDTLYFVSQRPSDDHKRFNWDIFVANRRGDGWTEAERVGAPINTPGNEFHVIIHQDLQTLYFSSDGHGGFGGADIFMAKAQPDGSWGQPENLGPLLNTPDNDMYFTIAAAGDLAYFASTRTGTHGLEDIYQIPVMLLFKPEGVIIVKGIVADRTTCTASTMDTLTQTRIYDIKSCTPINQAVVRLAEVVTDKAIKETVTGPSGFYQVVIPAGKDYSITAAAKDYTFHSERFNVSATQPYQIIEKNILLDPICVGCVFVINNVYFDFDKATLRPESKNELNNAIRWLKDNPGRRIEIGGHTDAKGSDKYNIRLSNNRAKSVYDYLIQVGGVNPARLEAYGYGERMPIATNATDEGRQLNRRVEFKILQ